MRFTEDPVGSKARTQIASLDQRIHLVAVFAVSGRQ
jgi:hypothetical protein